MRRITRSIYGCALTIARSLGATHVEEDNSTLNQWVPTINRNGLVFVPLASNIHPTLAGTSTSAFSLGAYVQGTDSDGMKIQYLAIGDMGHRTFTPADPSTQPSYTGPLAHMARHSGLYNMIPFVLRAQGNDLTPIERAKYRFRTWLTIGATKYIAYYLRVLPTGAITISKNYTTVNGASRTTVPFAPTADDLVNPSKPGMPGAPIETTGDYLSASAALAINFSAAEIVEMMNVGQLMYNNPYQSILSEFALCQGLDKNCNHSWNGTTRDTTTVAPEAVGVQVATFLNAYYPLTYVNNSLDVNLALGATEPLYGVNRP